MPVYYINERIEQRIKEWAKTKREIVNDIRLGGYSFSDIMNELLKEVGF
jgi:hypothetical protein